MKKILAFGLVLIACFVQAQNKMGVIYDDNVQVRKMPSFTSIKVSNAIELYLSQSNKTEVAVSASSEEYRDKIITEVVGGTLIIRMADNNRWWKWNDGDFKTKAYVSVKELYALTGSGATNIKIINGLSAEKLKVVLSGASDLKGDLKVGTLIAELSGASSMKSSLKANAFSAKGSGASAYEVTGSSEDLVVDVSGACTVKMYEFYVKGASVEASGASSVKVNVSELLKVRASGASSIDYKGNASIKEMYNTGASSVKHKN